MKAYGNQIKKKALGDIFLILIMNSMKGAGKITRKKDFLD
jgi:hypothetical protein